MKKLILIILTIFIISLTAVYANPVLDSIPAQTVNEGDAVSLTITTTAPDNGSTNFTLDSNTPVGGVSTVDLGGSTATLTKVSDTSATFAWTAPSVDTQKTYTVTVGAEDDNSSTTETLSITVNNILSGLAITDLNIGSDSQERSNPEAKDEDDEEVYDESSTFTITNNDATAATNVQVTWPSSSDYNISMVSCSVTCTAITGGVQFSSIPAGSDAIVTIRARIPEDLDSFFPERSNPQDDRAVDIGDLSLTATGYSEVTADVFLEAENNLEINELLIYIDGDKNNVDDGDEIEKIMPGAKVEIKLNAKSKLSSSAKIDIENVEFNFFVDDGDFDEDEDEDIGDIGPRDEKESTMTINLDDDMSEDTYTVTITLKGEDENGAVYGEQWEVDFTVEKEDEDIAIKSLEIDDETMNLCADSAKSTRIELTLDNIGADDSDEIVLVAKNSALDFFYRELKIDLNEGDDDRFIIPLNLPSNAKVGTYKIEVYSYFDYDRYDDEDINNYATVDLKLVACPTPVLPPQTEIEPKEEEEEVVVVLEDEKNDVAIPNQENDAIAVPVSTSVGASTSSVGWLVLGYIVVISIIILLLIKLLKK